MTNYYIKTRADQLQPGDVVRDPYSDGLEAVATYAADDGGMVRLVFDGNEGEAVLKMDGLHGNAPSTTCWPGWMRRLCVG